jgi:uncharacterized protein (TIGR02646 family)
MRPVEKGEAPHAFADYPEALPYLAERLGNYCSYCERRISNQLAVEHVQPKRHHEDLRLEWRNFLLACTNCNSTKGSQDLALEDYYWPDVDNTARAFTYREEGIVQVSTALSDDKRERAQRTLALTGLDRLPGHPRLTPQDRRWLHRQEVWEIARRAHSRLESADTRSMRDQIRDTATGYGFWSVWMTVFADDVDMKRRFCTAFPGTAPDCFDGDFNPVPRPGGAL